MTDRVHSYAKNLTTYFGASIIPMVLSLLTNPWIAQNMDPRDYAISGFYLSFTALISPIIVFYLIHYYIKEYFNRDEKEREKLFAVIAKSLIWFSGLVSVGCFLALFIYLRYFNPKLSFPIMPYLVLMVFSLPLTGLYSLQQAKYRMAKDAKSFFWLSLINSMLSLLLILLFVVVFKWGAFGKLLAPLVGNLGIFLYLLVQYKSIWGIKTDFKDFQPIFIFCLPLAVSAMLGYFTHGFSTTYLETIGDTNEYGIYIVGNSIAGYLTVFANAIGNTFQPDLYENIIRKQWRSYIKFCTLQISLIFAIVLVFIVLAPYIISLLTAGRYVASTTYAQIIALSTITSSIYFIVNNFSIATNRPKLYLYTSILGSAFIIICMPFATEKWSFVGGAWMNVVSFFVFSIINVLLLLLVKSKSPNPNK